VYVNIADPPTIVVVGAADLAVSRAITVAAAGPHGLAIVPERGGATLWCAADAGALVVIDRDSGETSCSLPLPGAPDVVMHDRERGRLYVAVGAPGTVSVFDTRRRTHLETVATEEGAHTIGWDPATGRLFVFQPRSSGVAIFEDSA
jgi:DNA-binding beta-propeller fold protein YncE